MNSKKFVIHRNYILSIVRYALELNIQETLIIDILMRDIETEIDNALLSDCIEYTGENEKVVK